MHSKFEIHLDDRVEDKSTGERGTVTKLTNYGVYGVEAEVLFDGTQVTIAVDTQLLRKIGNAGTRGASE